MNGVLAWYFAHPDERLAYGDGREVAVGAVAAADDASPYDDHMSAANQMLTRMIEEKFDDVI